MFKIGDSHKHEVQSPFSLGTLVRMDRNVKIFKIVLATEKNILKNFIIKIMK